MRFALVLAFAGALTACAPTTHAPSAGFDRPLDCNVAGNHAHPDHHDACNREP
jgi:hypothetical protein